MSSILEKVTVFDRHPVFFGTGVKNEIAPTITTYAKAVLASEHGFLPHKKQKTLCEKTYFVKKKDLTGIIGRAGAFGIMLIQDFPYDIFDVCDAKVLTKVDNIALLATKGGLYQWNVAANLGFYFNNSEVLGYFPADKGTFPNVEALKFTVKYLFLPDK